MNIHPISNLQFKGYDARPLKGFLMHENCYGIAKEMKEIGEIENFDIFTITTKNIFKQICSKKIPFATRYNEKIWTQDIYTFFKNKLYAPSSFNTNVLISKFNLINCQDTKSERHIKGGNLFFINNNNEDEIIVGESELKKYNLDELKDKYKINNITVLPQMDFHLDLFIRPLDNKKILLADDTKTIEILEKNLKKGDKRQRYQLYNFLQAMETNTLAQADEVAKTLENSGYNVIRVPARIYDSDGTEILKHNCNYINANVLKNKDNKLVYITNNSDINKILGFNFQEEFIKSILPYVEREHIYFVKGQNNFVADFMLKDFQGGIHCACSEIPQEVLINE